MVSETCLVSGYTEKLGAYRRSIFMQKSAMRNREGLSTFILPPCHVLIMVPADYRGCKENAMHMTLKTKSFTIEQEEKKLSGEMIFEKHSNLKT